MRKVIYIIIISIISISTLAQRYDRGGEEPGPPPSISGIILMIVIGIIILIVKSNYDLKRRKKAFKNIGVENISKIEFGRYAIKDEIRLEYPVAFIRNDHLEIISKEEADKTGEIDQKIVIPNKSIKSIEITKTQDSFAKSKGIGFTGSLTIFHNDSEITEFVFNDKYESEIKRFTHLRNKLMNSLNTSNKNK